MQRTIAAVGAVVVAADSMWLATAPAYAKTPPKTAANPPTATLHIMPRWTYLRGGKFAITTKCPAGKDSRVVFSRLLYRPVVVNIHVPQARSLFCSCV
jgi:hypothetical protein